MKKHWLKLAVVAVVGVLSVMAFQSKTDAGAADKKVTICHKGQTLEVAESAVQAHLNHGDTLGPCNITPSKNQ